ncbi:MAG: DUF5654 family protein [Candidatus Bathyarchaeota archaeon]
MASIEKLAQERNFHGLIVASMVTALAFVAGLFWRDAIQQLITEIIPEGEGLLYSFIVAFLVTIIVAVIIIFLVKTQEWKTRAKERIAARRAVKKSTKKKK